MPADGPPIIPDAVSRVIRGVGAFADDMRAAGIHVGIGSSPRCVTCGQEWPCEGSTDG